MKTIKSLKHILDEPARIKELRLFRAKKKLKLSNYTSRKLESILSLLSCMSDILTDMKHETEEWQDDINISDRPITRHTLSISAKHRLICYLLQVRRLYYDLLYLSHIAGTKTRYTGEEDFYDEREEIYRLINSTFGYTEKLYTFTLNDWKSLSRYIKTPEVFSYSNWHFSQARRYASLTILKLSQIYRRVATIKPAIARADKISRAALSAELRDDLIVHFYQLKKVYEDLLRVLQVGKKRKTNYAIKCTPSVGQVMLEHNSRIFDEEYKTMRRQNKKINKTKRRKRKCQN